VVQRGRLFVGGFAGGRSIAVRAYDAQTGTLLWQQKTTGVVSGFNTLRGLTSDGPRVFAGGTLASTIGQPEFLVQAIEAHTGRLLWEDRVNNGAGFDGADGIAFEGGRVFAQGQGGPGCLVRPSPPSDCDVLIRSYDARSGALLWEQTDGTVGLDDATPPQNILARGGMVFSAWIANIPTDGPQGDWVVQTYESATGQLLWEDRVDTGGGGSEGGEAPLGLVLLGRRFFVAGRTIDATDNWNFVVRAYAAGGQ
jgi:outer membrane protein assembly factor BamB